MVTVSFSLQADPGRLVVPVVFAVFLSEFPRGDGGSRGGGEVSALTSLLCPPLLLLGQHRRSRVSVRL